MSTRICNLQHYHLNAAKVFISLVILKVFFIENFHITSTKMGRQARMSETPPKNPNFNLSSTLAYGILAGTSAWALFGVQEPRKCRPFTVTAFSLLFVDAGLGIIRYGHPDFGQKVKGIYDIMTTITGYGLLPLINVDAFLSTRLPRELAYLQLTFCLVPSMARFVNQKYQEIVVDLCTMFNVMAILYLGYVEENPWAIGLAALSAMNHFVYTRLSNMVAAPKQDLMAIGHSFFALFAKQSMFLFKCPSGGVFTNGKFN